LSDSDHSGPPTRVAFLVTRYPCPADPVGGIFHQTSAESLVRAGCRVDAVAPVSWIPPGLPWFSSTARRRNAIPKNYLHQGVHVYRPRYFHLFRSGVHRRVSRAFCSATRRALPGPPDVIHAHYPYPCGSAALELARGWGCPVVLTLHGSDVNLLPSRGPLARRLFIEAVCGADCVIAVSDELARCTESIAGRLPRVLPIGIDLTFRCGSRSDAAAARNALGLPIEGTLLLFVGSLVPAKGVRHLLAAMPVLRQHGVTAVFIGEGPLRSSVEASPGSLAVGLKPNDQVAEYMAAADLLVLPSDREGMPTVLIEAGAAGLPVVATSVGGISSLLGDDRGLLIEPGSADEVLRGVQAVLDQPELARRRAARLRRYVETHYDADRNADTLKAIYRDVVCKTSGKCAFG